MKTLTLKCMTLCGSMPTTASGVTAFAAGRSLAFAEAILAKYSGMAGTEPSGAVMVFLTAHKDEAETERRRREHIELALKLVFVKYLASRAEFHPITVNNTFTDYLQTASLLINAPARIESPRAFAAAQMLAGNLQSAQDPGEVSDALAVYLHSETNMVSRAQLVHTVENILRGQSAAEQHPESADPAAASRTGSDRQVHPSAANLLAEKETVRRFAELVYRENPALPSAAEPHKVQVHEVHEIREQTSSAQPDHRDSTHTETHTETASERAETREVRELRAQLETAQTLREQLHSSEQIHHRDSTHTETHTETASERAETREVRELRAQLETARLQTVEHTAQTETHRLTDTIAADAVPENMRSDSPVQELPAMVLHSMTSGGFRYMMQSFTRAAHRRFHTDALLERVYHTIGARIAERSQTALTRTLNLMRRDAVRTDSERMLVGQAAAAVLLRRITAGEDADAMLASMTSRERAETMLVVHRILTAHDADSAPASVPIPAETVKAERFERLLLQTIAQDTTLTALRTAAGQANSSILSRISEVIFRRTENTSSRQYTETISALRMMRTERAAGTPPVIHTIRPVRSLAVLASGRSFGLMGRYPALSTADNLPAYSAGQILQNTLRSVSHLHRLQTADTVQPAERRYDNLPEAVLRYYTAVPDKDGGQVSITTLRGTRLETLAAERTLAGVTQLTERILRESITHTMMQAVSPMTPDVSAHDGRASYPAMPLPARDSLQTILRETARISTQEQNAPAAASHTSAEMRVHELLRERTVRELRTLLSQKTFIRNLPEKPLPAAASFEAAASSAVQPATVNVVQSNPMALLLRTNRTIRAFADTIRTELLRTESVHTDAQRENAVLRENRVNTDTLRTELLHTDAAGRSEMRMQIPVRMNMLALAANRFIGGSTGTPFHAPERMTLLPGRRMLLSRNDHMTEHASYANASGRAESVNLAGTDRHTDARPRDAAPAAMDPLHRTDISHTDVMHRTDISHTDVMHRTEIAHRADFSALRETGRQSDIRKQDPPSAYTHDAPMSFRREAQTAAPADQPSEASLTKQELISRYGNLIDDPMQSAPSDAAAVSVFGADPRDDTKKMVREQAEQLAVQKVQIEELTKKQAVLESGLLKYSDTRRLCDEVMQRLKSQIRLEKSRYMG